MLSGGCAPLKVIPLPQGFGLGCVRVDLDITALPSRHRHSCGRTPPLIMVVIMIRIIGLPASAEYLFGMS